MNRRHRWLAWALLGAAIYVAVACIVFQWRHPWMTEMERFLHMPEAVLWQAVDYQEARPR